METRPGIKGQLIEWQTILGKKSPPQAGLSPGSWESNNAHCHLGNGNSNFKDKGQVLGP